MAQYQTILVVLMGVIAMILIAMRVNRDGKHPTLGALLWICAVTLLVWGVMVTVATS
jgi:hypothetical protein